MARPEITGSKHDAAEDTPELENAAAEAEIPRLLGSVTIDAFCEAEGISRSTFFKLLREGNAPAVMTLPGTRVRRVTYRAWHAWQRRNESQDDASAAKRRVAAAKHAARVAAASPAHTSKNPELRKRRSA